MQMYSFSYVFARYVWMGNPTSGPECGIHIGRATLSRMDLHIGIHSRSWPLHNRLMTAPGLSTVVLVIPSRSCYRNHGRQEKSGQHCSGAFLFAFNLFFGSAPIWEKDYKRRCMTISSCNGCLIKLVYNMTASKDNDHVTTGTPDHEWHSSHRWCWR